MTSSLVVEGTNQPTVHCVLRHRKLPVVYFAKEKGYSHEASDSLPVLGEAGRFHSAAQSQSDGQEA